MTKTALEAAYNGLLHRGRLLHDPHQVALVARLASLQDELAATNTFNLIPGQTYHPPRGVYIYGSVGTGKSRIADLFAATLPPTISKRRDHFHTFMNDIHDRLHRARSLAGYSGDPLIQIGRNIREESRVLVFDEFQVTDIADAMILSRLFGSIWREGGVMVSTSNRPPDGLYENGLNRDVVLPFVREVGNRCEVWEIGGREDYRMRGLKDKAGSHARVETFFTDQNAFDQTLARALGNMKLNQISLPVYGSRSLNIDAAARVLDGKDSVKRFDLVSATFEQLCQAPHSSADYQALCLSTDTVFVSGLRKFETMEKDFVRRFITMIDLAYETRTRVVCLSSVPLGQVFENIVHVDSKLKKELNNAMRVTRDGGASSSMMSTFIGETEWSATGLADASLATGGAGETDVGFAVGRAISRLYEMGSKDYGARE